MNNSRGHSLFWTGIKNIRVVIKCEFNGQSFQTNAVIPEPDTHNQTVVCCHPIESAKIYNSKCTTGATGLHFLHLYILNLTWSRNLFLQNFHHDRVVSRNMSIKSSSTTLPFTVYTTTHSPY